MTTLRVFRHKRLYRATSGGDGQSKGKHGKNGVDLVIAVPLGTVVWQKLPDGGDNFLADLEQADQRVVIAKGGRGGLGNIHFASSVNQAPRTATSGQAGEESHVILELRLIADAGIVAYPNAGKSTLLARATAARPKIADYPFTTLEPVLGVVESDRHRFILAEIPGLVDGAHLGRGLGHDFLRHITRTRVIIHLVNGTSPSPVDDMIKVNNELALFDSELAKKPQLVAVNKIDLPEVRARIDEIKKEFDRAGVKVWFVSAATGEGVAELMNATRRLIDEVSPGEIRVRPLKVFRPQPIDTTVHWRKEDHTFIVTSPEPGRRLPQDVSRPAAWPQLKKELSRLGIIQALTEAGIKPGDTVRWGNREWEWQS
jgi:GTP-binding protein